MGSADAGAAPAPSPWGARGARERTSGGGVGRGCPSPNARLGRQPRLFSPTAKLGLTWFTPRSPNLLLFERGSQLPSLTLRYCPCGGVRRACVFSGNFRLICVQTMASHLCDLPAPGAPVVPAGPHREVSCDTPAQAPRPTPPDHQRRWQPAVTAQGSLGRQTWGLKAARGPDRLLGWIRGNLKGAVT